MVSRPNREVCDALHGEKAGLFFAGAGRYFRPIRANAGAKVNGTKIENGGQGEIQCFAIGNIPDGVGREFRVCLLLRGRSTTCAAGRCRTNGPALVRHRRHAAVGSERLSVVRYAEHVSESVCAARQVTKSP